LFDSAISISPRRRDWMFSSVIPGSVPANSGASASPTAAFCGAADRHRVQPAAQGLCCGRGVFQRMGRRELDWQHHAAHVFRPQGIDRHGRHDGAVDAARQPQQGLLEPRLAHVVAQGHDAGAIIGLADRRDRRLLALIRMPALGAAAKGDHPAAFVELRHLVSQVSAGVQDHRGAVEDLVVLPAHHVQVAQRQPGLDHAGDHQVQPQVRLAAVVGAAVRHQQDLGPGLGQGLGHVGVPGILADRRADAHAVHHIGARHVGRGEDALFVEDRLVRQVVLQDRRADAWPPCSTQ
jgi:hypothetical protein